MKPEDNPPPMLRAVLTRRDFGRRLGWTALGFGAASLLPVDPVRAAESASTRPSKDLLERSAFVYISPLSKNGQESTCHAELWYAWLDESVVVTVASDRWKAKALARGLDRARVWVGDHGRWKTWYGGRNEAFRSAPHFETRVEKISDASVLDRLLEAYEAKYPDEIADWREPMRKGNADGSRVMLRYTPIG